MSSVRVEARRPPLNTLAMTGGLGTRLIQALQLFADLQVCTVRRDVKAWLSQRKGALLEVGCGDQPYRSLVPAGCSYLGIDRGEAKNDFDMRVKEEVVLYSGDVFPCSDATFDALLHTEVLEHVYNYRIFLRECHRVLKTGGEMMFTVPFQARFHFAPHDYFRYTPSALQAILKEAGFAEITVTPRGTDITVAAYKAAAVGFRWAYGNFGSKLLFLLTSPATLLLLTIAHISILSRLGSSDDCLGYSVRARAAQLSPKLSSSGSSMPKDVAYSGRAH
jgi:2-polyprenyl-3-methyl-5-hydroxy-6-metoxy-1,4-benzoquinol methylase